MPTLNAEDLVFIHLRVPLIGAVYTIRVCVCVCVCTQAALRFLVTPPLPSCESVYNSFHPLQSPKQLEC